MKSLKCLLGLHKYTWKARFGSESAGKCKRCGKVEKRYKEDYYEQFF